MGEAEVPSGRRPQSKEPLFPRGDVCCTRQQTVDFCAAPFLRFLQCGSCRRARAGWPNALRPARHGGEEGGSEKPWKQRLRVKSARGEEALNLHCATKCRGRDVRVRVEVRRAPWRRRTRRTARRQLKCAVSALGVEEKVIARESAQGHVRRRRAFVWRRARSGHARVCAGHAGR